MLFFLFWSRKPGIRKNKSNVFGANLNHFFTTFKMEQQHFFMFLYSSFFFGLKGWIRIGSKIQQHYISWIQVYFYPSLITLRNDSELFLHHFPGWDLAECGWDLAECGWDLAECGWDLAESRWDLAVCGWDLAEWLELLAVNAKVVTVLGSIPASSDKVESEGRQMKPSWITYLHKKDKIQKNPPLGFCWNLFPMGWWTS